MSLLQISNAVTLQKTVEHIGKLQQDRQQMQEEVRRLREEIEELNASIRCLFYSSVWLTQDTQEELTSVCFLRLFHPSLCQEQLPATGVPVTRHRYDHMQEKFNEYVKIRTHQNWKFWVVSFSAWILYVLSVLRSETKSPCVCCSKCQHYKQHRQHGISNAKCTVLFWSW